MRIIPCVFGFYCLCFMMHKFMFHNPFVAEQNVVIMIYGILQLFVVTR